MNKAGKIISVKPPRAIPGGEVLIECENFDFADEEHYGCFFDGQAGKLVGASAERILVKVPDDFDDAEVEVHLESGGDRSDSATIIVGRKLAGDMHIVANPAIDPKDDSIILTRSGSRGQQLPVTLFRLEKDGYLGEMPVDILNPTGVAFDKSGQLFVTARAEGDVYRVNHDKEFIPFASDLGIATGIAFDENNEMFVGDRSGTIYKVSDLGHSESFALLEPSVSAYHLAFGTDGRLYLSAPGLASFDAIYAIDKNGFENVFFKGLGRPQGLAFDADGNLYVAACLNGRHGIVKISNDGADAEIFVAGMNVIGLCFTKNGEMIAATNEAVYNLPIEVHGILLN